MLSKLHFRGACEIQYVQIILNSMTGLVKFHKNNSLYKSSTTIKCCGCGHERHSSYLGKV